MKILVEPCIELIESLTIHHQRAKTVRPAHMADEEPYIATIVFKRYHSSRSESGHPAMTVVADSEHPLAVCEPL